MDKEQFIYLVYECDEHFSINSQVLVQCCSSIENAVNEIIENGKFHKGDYKDYDSKEQFLEYVRDFLDEHLQTPTLITNYIILEVAVDGIWSELCY